MSCLQKCNKKEHYFVYCNYDYNGYTYTPRTDNTCQRDNIESYFPEDCDICKEVVDCCADDRTGCCQRSNTALPTTYPTSQPTTLCGNEPVHYLQESEMCNFLETRNKDITKLFDNSMMCCSSKRIECCHIKTTEIWIGFASFITFVLFVVYIHLRPSCYRVKPESEYQTTKKERNIKILPV